MKKNLLLLILCGLLHNMNAQSKGSLEQYCYIGQQQAFAIVPVMSYETSNSWHFEGRYNYEELKSFSLYAGKTFEKKSKVSYAVTPIAGVVAGSFNGGSVGANISADYKKFFFSSQLQYSFSTENKRCNFLYNWSDVSYEIYNWLYGGASFQQTKLFNTKMAFEKGLFVDVEINKHAFYLYLFNPCSSKMYFIMGLRFDWQQKQKDVSK